MGDDDDLEVTREGLLDLLAGKAKEAAGSLVGNDDLAREGRRQQAEAEADPDREPEAPGGSGSASLP